MPKKSMVFTPRTEMVQSTTFRRFKLLSEDMQNWIRPKIMEMTVLDLKFHEKSI